MRRTRLGFWGHNTRLTGSFSRAINPIIVSDPSYAALADGRVTRSTLRDCARAEAFLNDAVVTRLTVRDDKP